MAKRRTLKRQRDKALAELQERSEHIILQNAIKYTNYHYDVHRFSAKMTVTPEMRLTPTQIIRRLLHDIVDKGYLDGFVRKRSSYNAGMVGMPTIENYIELAVLQPEENFEENYFINSKH